MDHLNQNPVVQGSQMPPQGMMPKPKSSVGPIAGTIIIILLLMVGGLYFWGAKLNEQASSAVPYIPSNDTYEDNTTGELQSDTSAGLPSQSSSDDVSAIQADANAMNMGELESQNSAELNNI